MPYTHTHDFHQPLNNGDFFASTIPICSVLTVGLLPPLLEHSPEGESNSTPSHSSKHSNSIRRKLKKFMVRIDISLKTTCLQDFPSLVSNLSCSPKCLSLCLYSEDMLRQFCRTWTSYPEKADSQTVTCQLCMQSCGWQAPSRLLSCLECLESFLQKESLDS